jgi:hypothetical protein
MSIGLGTTRSPDALKGIVEESSIRWLGSHQDDRYGVHKGREYVFSTSAYEDPGDPGRRPGVLVVRGRRQHVFDGSTVESSSYLRGREVPLGTYEAILAAEAKQRAKQERARRPLPVDTLAGGPFAGRGDMIVPTPARASVILGAAVPVNVGGFAPGRRSARGPAAMLRRLQAKGIELNLKNGHLEVRAPGGRLSLVEREAIRAAMPLLAAHLAGAPLRCELPHDGEPPEAETIVAVDIPACAAHLAGKED